MLFLRETSLVLLAWLAVSLRCSPLAHPNVHKPLHTSAKESSNVGSPNIRDAFSIILSSTTEVINETWDCESHHLKLSESEIEQNFAQAQMLLSKLVSYESMTEGPDFDFLVFVDDSISYQRRRHLQNGGAKVHHIKTLQVSSQACATTPLKCDDVLSTEDFIRSSEDIDMSDYDKIVLLDLDIYRSPHYTQILVDLRAQPLLSRYRFLQEEHKRKHATAVAAARYGHETPFVVAFNWVEEFFGIGNIPRRLSTPAEVFPEPNSLMLLKPAINMFEHYALFGETPYEKYTSWEICLA